MEGHAMTYAARLHAALTATGNIAQENLAAARDAAELAHSIDRIREFIEDATTLIQHSDVEDEYDVERALNGWEGIDAHRTDDVNAVIADVGATQAFNAYTELFQAAPDTAYELAAVVLDDLVRGVRSMVQALAEGIEAEGDED